MWFFGGSIFVDWMSIGSLLWIHGKRTLPLSFPAKLLMVSRSGVWEEHPLVRPFSAVIADHRNSY